MGALVRRHDPDRYLCTLFAPAPRREALFVLYAFNHELARAREAVREPFAALIRLQWWREVVEGARRRHEVAGPLGAALDAGLLRAADLMGLIEAREAEAEPMENVASFTDYVRGSAGGLMVAAGHALGMEGAEALRDWGAAYGVAGVLRSVPALARQGRCLLPQDLLAEAGLSEAAVVGRPALAITAAGPLLVSARTWLHARPEVPRPAWAAALPVVLARRDLAAWPGGAFRDRTLRDRVIVTWSGLRHRL